MNKVINYARFYSLLKKMPCNGERDELKEQLVWQFTNLRTESLRSMSETEYNNMCNHMQKIVSEIEGKESKAALSVEQLELKQARSAVLKRIQKLGIDTTDFANVDNFCLNVKIAGKVFRKLTFDELKALIPKLESILKKDANAPFYTTQKYRLN